jgi:hypothetical protein
MLYGGQDENPGCTLSEWELKKHLIREAQKKLIPAILKRSDKYDKQALEALSIDDLKKILENLKAGEVKKVENSN